jgi:hypothetical protein
MKLSTEKIQPQTRSTSDSLSLSSSLSTDSELESFLIINSSKRKRVDSSKPTISNSKRLSDNSRIPLKRIQNKVENDSFLIPTKNFVKYKSKENTEVASLKLKVK